MRKAPEKLKKNQTKLFLFLFVFFILMAGQANSKGKVLPITYDWIPQYYGKVNGVSKLLYSRGFSRSQLRFADIDGDGDEDLFVGKADGRIALFRNKGTATQENFVLETEDFEVIHEKLDENKQLTHVPTILDVGDNAVPELADIDGDGDFDLFVGSKDGHIFHYENRGNQLLPRFFRVTPIFMGLKFGGNSVPRFADLNGDRALDLLVGTRSGDLKLFFNSGMNTEAVYCPEFNVNSPPDSRCKFQPESIASISPLVDAVPEWVDWDQDGDWDLVVGKSNGKLDFYWNHGDRFSPEWILKSQHFQFIDTGGTVAPTFHDLNRDGFPELFLGTSNSRVFFYENREVVMDNLRRLPGLDLGQLNPNAPLEILLEQACSQLRGLPDCVIPLAETFGVPGSVKVKELGQLTEYILRPDNSIDIKKQTAPAEGGETIGNTEGDPEAEPQLQANTNTAEGDATENADAAAEDGEAGAEDGTEEGIAEAGKEEKVEAKPDPATLPVITRNQLWLSTRNYLNFFKLVGNDRFTSTASGDWNKDGKMDLLVGSRSGRIYAFENQGEKETDWKAISFPALDPNRRRHSSPFLADLDGDGDLDIISGNRQGRIEWLQNNGKDNSPEWIIKDIHVSQIDVGSYSSPILNDLDGDKDLDLIIGNSRGLIIYYENQGTANAPHFVLLNTRLSGVQTKGNAVPATWKWNEDDHDDLVIGGKEGFLSLVTHIPPKRSPALRGWSLAAQKWQNLITIGFSTPHFTDLDGDKKPDLLMGDKEGNLLFWKNGGFQKIEEKVEESTIVMTGNTLEEAPVVESQQGEQVAVFEQAEADIPNEPIEPAFELVSSDYGNLRLGRRAFPAFLDIDGDQDYDLVVGNHAGELRYYRQEEASDSNQWVLETKQFLGYQGGQNAAPIFADLDGDGDADLLVGNERGSIQYWENQGNSDLPEFILNPTPFTGVTGGRNSVPAVLDLDRDGKNDLLIGNFLGQIRKYLRIDSSSGFRFRLNMRSYMNLDVGLGAVPKITDLNNDQLPDLIIGSDGGKIISFQPDPKTPDTWGWKPTPDYFKSLKLPVGGSPVFVDMDHDGDLDLFIGSEKGTLHYFKNTGRNGEI